ncbi:M20/M25/M40 family metallo-hydrolase [Neomoorella mulderi]|uniref:Putative succinyl-diaminopimelate desuccinylase n=1 Tax=Moorella mulderi DSM 14980 TaxID=1122241 RepID=A0A151AW32_9FIRM|nr:M20/M25/M40 family metallo-hydrolase [Moorella mulderi]KYH31617.1 putative succinyl-diaminopimelate desuccinylase [Moorella mulderi DSM 14980]
MQDVDWGAVAEEATSILQGLVRIDTTNPPGNETAAAFYLAEILRREGLSPEVIEPQPGRGSLICRLSGSGERGDPLLLLSHLDVVGVERDKWERDPFSGELAGGYIWGRGTLDCKGLTVMEVMVLLLLWRQGRKLGRDLILAATADEETGGKWGAGWLVANRPDLIDAPYVINEGGGYGFVLGSHRYYACQVGEKGRCRFRVTTKGKGGHASRPTSDNPIFLMGRVLQSLNEMKMSARMTQTIREFFRITAAGQPPEVVTVLDKLARGCRLNAEETSLLPEGLAADIYATTHDTLSPTILKAGEKINVIPSEATLMVDARLVPGSEPAAFLDRVREQLSPLGGVEVEVIDSGSGLEADPDSELYRCMAEVIAEEEQGAALVPFLSTGGTDAKHLCKRNGVRVYGFMPTRPDPDAPVRELLHSHNERISVENLLFGTRLLYNVVRRFCS